MAQINMPRQQEKQDDPLDRIAKGLALASSLFGIKDARDKSELLQRQQAQSEANAAFQKAAGQASLLKAGYEAQKQDDGTYSLVAREGYRDLEEDLKRSQIAKNLADASKRGDEGGLAHLIKQQQAVLQGLNIQEHQRKAGEIEGPKAMAATYGRRLEQADQIMQDLAAGGYDRSAMTSGLESYLPSGMQSAGAQKQSQAEKNFVTALLRRESGAAISKDEFKTAEDQYFDRAGDSPEVRAQKAQNRAQAIAGMRAEAGHAWDKIPLANTPQSVVDTLSAQQKQKLQSVLTLPKANASPKLNAKDEAALNWAKKNPNDPRAKQILQLNGL